METVSPELQALLALHLVPNLGPRRAAFLLERFGSAMTVFEAPAHELSEVPHIGSRLAQESSSSARSWRRRS